jgi:hypothetical protein
MTSTQHSTDIIRALQAKKKAEQDLAAAENVALNARLADAFAPVFDFITSVMELPSKHYRWHCESQRIPFRAHLATFSKTAVSFYAGDGNTGLSVHVSSPCGVAVFRVSEQAGLSDRQVTPAQALEMVQAYAAERIVLPEPTP